MSTNPGTATRIFRRESERPHRSRSMRSVVFSWIAAAAARELGFAKNIVRRARVNAAHRRLSAMPDHMLKDIGISRSELGYRVQYGRAEYIARLLPR